jgi:hypothetical protein
MTKVEFEKGYCERSGISLEEYEEDNVTLSCNCGHESCEGWAAVSNRPLSIKAHKDLCM